MDPARFSFRRRRPGRTPHGPPARLAAGCISLLVAGAAAGQAPSPAATAPAAGGPAVAPPPRLVPARRPAHRPFALTVKAGLAYDSNVAISQIDASTGVGDMVGSVGVAASYKWVDRSSRSLSIGYDFSQTLHARLSAYDIQLHGIAVSGSLPAGKATLGMTYGFNHLLLGGKPFLDLQLASPSLFVPLGRKVYGRASFTYLGERFPIDHRRDAGHLQPQLQAFYFFDGARSFVLLGGSYQRENAADPQFSYAGRALSASVTKSLRLARTAVKLKAEYEHVRRDYDAPTPSIGAKRFDRLAYYRLSTELPLARRWSLVVEGKYIARRSNVQYANIDESVGSTELVFRF